jgi:SNF2 family DNA or RNA helicase
MMITPYHALYLSHELTLRRSSDSVEKFSATLANAQVDINPHQIEAALFAFRSPLSRGAILADEVGLGKTIEAGIVIAQKWAEKKQSILLIVPANLRKQWMSELSEKFFLPSVILEQKSFNTYIKSGNLNPFIQESKIVIASYQFIKSKAPYVKSIDWDLVVIDEAHRLRNVYKTGSKMAREIKDALATAPKILLTATPLQNSLLELYGLVSIIDDQYFGDLKSFKAKYSKVSQDQILEPEVLEQLESMGHSESPIDRFVELRERLAPICNRTLRRQVLEYINYTDRIPLTQEYFPWEDEMLLYEQVSEYLQMERLYALPNSQRQLVTLILRKLLASSSFAIAQTLEKLIFRLDRLMLEAQKQIISTSESFDLKDFVFDTYDGYDQTQDDYLDDEEWDEDSTDSEARTWTPGDIKLMSLEKEVLQSCYSLARKIFKNSKGESLLIALQKGFEMTAELWANKKAIIFTESTVTQAYIKTLLEANGYIGKIVLFNGTNTDPQTQDIYKRWLTKNTDTDKVSGSKTADTRAAIIDWFKYEGEIMIATEAGAEGVNLQFCSLLINYDLPWNPQRIEQRIGRCHRYGQKHDVVVINFINRKNAADARIYELLDQKFKLFKGVFGASDEVLGAIESGVDFEKRISEILLKCRTTGEINSAFDDLRLEMDESIQENLTDTRQKLLENFDEDVRARLKANQDRSRASLDFYDLALWEVTKYFLDEWAIFSESGYFFELRSNPFGDGEIYPGPYRIGKWIEDAHIYRPEHPLAKRIIEKIQSQSVPDGTIVFDYTHYESRISALESLVGKSGMLILARTTVSSFEIVDEILAGGVMNDGAYIDADTIKKLWKLSGKVSSSGPLSEYEIWILNTRVNTLESEFLASIHFKNAAFFDEETAKLDRWTDDMKISLEIELKRLDIEIATLRTQSRKIIQLADKVAAQKELKNLEKQRSDMRRDLYTTQDQIEWRRDTLISQVEARLGQTVERKVLFRVRFEVV